MVKLDHLEGILSLQGFGTTSILCPLCTNLTWKKLSNTTDDFLRLWLVCTEQNYELVVTLLQVYTKFLFGVINYLELYNAIIIYCVSHSLPTKVKLVKNHINSKKV